MLPILSSQQLRELDQVTCFKQKVTKHELITRAAKGFISASEAYLASEYICIFIGPGFNGADGAAIAYFLLKHKSIVPLVFCYGEPCEEAHYFLEKLPINLGKIQDQDDIPKLPPHGIIIDALFGSGFTPRDDELLKAVFESINSADGWVISVDLPSGINADGNFTHGHHIHADMSVVFEVNKLPRVLRETASAFGNSQLIGIDLDDDFIEAEARRHILQKQDVQRFLPHHASPYIHKYSKGGAVVVAGSSNMQGAAYFACAGAYRAGAGIVQTWLGTSELGVLQARLPEAVVYALATLKKPQLKEQLKKYQAIAYGPGLQKQQVSKEFLKLLLKENKPLVLDATALSVLNPSDKMLTKCQSTIVLTPHEGEFDSMFGSHHTTLERIKTAEEFVDTCPQAILVLKGRHTIVFSKQATYFINNGCTGMATAGSGDILTGILVGLLAQCPEKPLEMVYSGVYLHGLAGNIAEYKKGAYATMASDILEAIPEAMLRLRGREEVFGD